MKDTNKYSKPTPEIRDCEFREEKTDVESLPVQVDKEKFLEMWNKWTKKYSNLVHLLAQDK